MKKYAADTAACRLIGLLGTRWTMLTLFTLEERGTLRFNELRRAMPGAISERMLSSVLRDLEAEGLVLRRVWPEVPPRVEYRLAPETGEVLPMLHRLIGWAQEYEAARSRSEK